MTDEMKAYLENSVSFMNYCKRMADKAFKLEEFSEVDYLSYSERYITLRLMIDGLANVLGMNLVEENGSYKVK